MSLSNFSDDLLRHPMGGFTKHFEIEGNNQVLFSGKFGTGKTYFLSKYFSDDWQKVNYSTPKYAVTSLWPVNYSISSNEDIFRYIKYDIIVSLLAEGNYIGDDDVDFLGNAALFLHKHKLLILKKVLGILPKVGASLDEVFRVIEELH